MCGPDAAAHKGQVSPPLPWPFASSLWHHPVNSCQPWRGSALITGPHHRERKRKRAREEEEEEEEEEGGECGSVCLRTCTYVCLCKRVCVSCTVAMTHTVWGLQCICAQHDKCVTLDSISSLQPHSIWCQLCTPWYRARSVFPVNEKCGIQRSGVLLILFCCLCPGVREIHSLQFKGWTCFFYMIQQDSHIIRIIDQVDILKKWTHMGNMQFCMSHSIC